MSAILPIQRWNVSNASIKCASLGHCPRMPNVALAAQAMWCAKTANKHQHLSETSAMIRAIIACFVLILSSLSRLATARQSDRACPCNNDLNLPTISYRG